jgi:excisionase family DNA binding protein
MKIFPLRQECFLRYKKFMTSDELLTTSEVAARLNVSLRRVRQLIEEGRLPSKKFGRDHLIKESDLTLVENRKTGRPPKAKGATDSKASKKSGGKK